MNDISKITMILVCLAFVSVSVLAQGSGGFTIGTDAGYSGTGSYNTPHTITYDSATTPCIGSSIPKWYIQQSGLIWTPIPPSGCIVGPNSNDTSDFDSDGCKNKIEYLNFLCLNQSLNCGLANLDCACEQGGICDPFNPNYDGEFCPGYCQEMRHMGEEADAIPEFSGTAIILLFVLSIVAYAFISHFHKE